MMQDANVLRSRNNHAAAMIAEGKHKEAYEELQHAMNVAAHFSSQQQQQSPEGAIATKSSTSATRIIALTATDRLGDSKSAPMFPWPLLSLPAGERNHNDDTDELATLSVACAITLFNMGLACHGSSLEKSCAIRKRNRLVAQAENLYLQAFEVGVYFDMEILNVALFINLMDISFERGDLTALSFWLNSFTRQTKSRLSRNLPPELLAVIWKLDLYFAMGLVAARAA